MFTLTQRSPLTSSTETLDELLDSADHALFCVIAHNPLHVLHPLLPQKNSLQFT